MAETNIRTEALVVGGAKEAFAMTPVILDEMRPNEVLMEMKYTGICHTDLLAQQGLFPAIEFPAIFGHEGAGIIKALGRDVKDKSLKVGDYALLSTTMCGSCQSCLKNQGNKCRTEPNVNFVGVRVSDGKSPASLEDGRSVRSQFFGQSSFSRLSVVHEHCIVRCPYPESLAFYAPLGCGLQTGAGTVFNTLRPGSDSRIVIFGLGSVGMAALMAATYLNLEQRVAVDIVDQKLSLATELGATNALNSTSCEDVVAEVKAITQGGADFAIDCTGVPSVIQAAVDCLGAGGTAVSIGLPSPTSKIQVNAFNFVFGNKTYLGVTGGGSPSQEFIPKLMELHQQGHFPIDRLCGLYPVDRFDQALKDLKTGSVLKPIICWE